MLAYMLLKPGIEQARQGSLFLLSGFYPARIKAISPYRCRRLPLEAIQHCLNSFRPTALVVNLNFIAIFCRSINSFTNKALANFYSAFILQKNLFILQIHQSFTSRHSGALRDPVLTIFPARRKLVSKLLILLNFCAASKPSLSLLNNRSSTSSLVALPNFSR